MCFEHKCQEIKLIVVHEEGLKEVLRTNKENKAKVKDMMDIILVIIVAIMIILITVIMIKQ